jgi:hypothetical protein
MKKLFVLSMICGLATFCSCQKQQSEEERNAEIERQVQQRLAAERQTQTEEQLAKQKSELEAREKALAEKEAAVTNAPMVKALETPLRAPKSDTSRTSPTASYSTFYTNLEPYGVWRETSSYGYIFQPREAERSRTWRPYTYGRWVYTDVGWTWVSEEPFGWATYHYGRWTRLRNIGWVWVPGEEWAPAWVSWRKSNDYVGWAPLPPEARFDPHSGIHNWADNYYDIGPDQYCFVPANQFGARRVEPVVVPAERNVTIANQTMNVTKITYNNTVIVNQGPDYDELRARSQQPIERLRLEHQTTVNAEAESPRSVIKGAVIQVPAPVIARAQAAERPRTIKEKIAQTTAERGWEGIADQKAAEKARAKIQAESTPPPNAPQKTFVKPVQPSAESSPPIPSSSPTPPAFSPAQAPKPTATLEPVTPLASPKIPAPKTTASPTPRMSGRMPIPAASPSAASQPRQAPQPSETVTAHPQEATATTPPTFLPPHPVERELNRSRRFPEGRSRRMEKPPAETSPGEGASGSSIASPSPAESPEHKEKKRQKRGRVEDGDNS